MPMMIQIDEDEVAVRIADADLLAGEILWHVAADHLSDEDVAAAARLWADQAAAIDATDGRAHSFTLRLAALLRAMAAALEATQPPVDPRGQQGLLR